MAENKKTPRGCGRSARSAWIVAGALAANNEGKPSHERDYAITRHQMETPSRHVVATNCDRAG